MDDISLTYYDDVRNGLSIIPNGGFVARPNATPPRVVPSRAFFQPRGPFVSYPPAPVMQPVPVMQQAPVMAYPSPTYGYPAPGGRRSLRDLPLAELLPALALGLAALRPLPQTPPIEPGDTGVASNVANQSRYLMSLASHAQSDLQLIAIGTAIAKLLGGGQ